MKYIFIVALIVLLSACETFYADRQAAGVKDATQVDTKKKSRYELEHDRGPSKPMDVSHIVDPIPKHEPHLKAGNYSPYEVLGKKYHVNFNYKGFKQQGFASWYGEKFHGKRTSNGEIYNMYGMTAAHKTLPIPVYVRVTNLENRRQVIVRVNDRGPFHGNRIIDLTYTAAKKLGFQSKGTAKVKIEVLDPDKFKQAKARSTTTTKASPTNLSTKTQQAGQAPKPRASGGYDLPEQTYLQVGAFGTIAAAQKLMQRLRSMTRLPIKIEPIPQRQLHKVLVGPILDNFELMTLREKVVSAALAEPHVVYAREE